MKPPRSVLDPMFIYTGSANTDIRKTFAKARRKIAADKARQEQEQASKVTQLRKAK